MTVEVERHSYDVVVIGAGGAGLRAVIEARERGGLKVAVVTKSLFGKAHTVMAEGGCAAAMRNVNTKDSWQVHFGDTMRGGKFLNNWRMAELHAQEAPDRVWELETYGALFDRTKDGKISQRNFGGHTYRAWRTSVTAPGWRSFAPCSRRSSRCSRRTRRNSATTRPGSRSSTSARSPT